MGGFYEEHVKAINSNADNPAFMELPLNMKNHPWLVIMGLLYTGM
jgi:hypothetical protein